MIIRAYYPTKKILDNELEVIVWCDEFANYDKDITVKAVRELCTEDKDGYKVNIASIKERVAEIEEEIKKEEYYKQQQKEIEEKMNYRPSEYTRNKFKEMLAKFGR